MAARFRIIVNTIGSDAGRTSFKLIFWYDVPTARQRFYANPLKTSMWIDALPADVPAITSGAVFEEVVDYSPDGSQGIAAVEAGAAALWTAKNLAFQNMNPWARNGTTWDGTTWVLNAVN